MAHGQDQCFHCIYDNLCGGLSKTDCQSIEKEKWKKLVDNETKYIQGEVKTKKSCELFCSDAWFCFEYHHSHNLCRYPRSLYQDHSNEAVAMVEAKTREILSKLNHEIRQKQTSMIEDIREREKDLLTNVKKNPRKWNRNQLEIKITTSESKITVPYVQIEYMTPDKVNVSNVTSDSTSTEQRFDGPYSPNGDETIGKIEKVYPNYELTFEMKIDEVAITTNAMRVLRLNYWFLFYVSRTSASIESKYQLQLRVVEL